MHAGVYKPSGAPGKFGKPARSSCLSLSVLSGRIPNPSGRNLKGNRANRPLWENQVFSAVQCYSEWFSAVRGVSSCAPATPPPTHTPHHMHSYLLLAVGAFTAGRTTRSPGAERASEGISVPHNGQTTHPNAISPPAPNPSPPRTTHTTCAPTCPPPPSTRPPPPKHRSPGPMTP